MIYSKNKAVLLCISLGLLIAGLLVALAMTSRPDPGLTATPSPVASGTLEASVSPSYSDITIDAPVVDSTVSSPLTVTGQARGTWFFEASFPVKLVDSEGKVLVQAPAQAQGDWMTEEFVPFSVELKFDKPTTATGVLILEKDNPSGLPENDQRVEIPVKF